MAKSLLLMLVVLIGCGRGVLDRGGDAAGGASGTGGTGGCTGTAAFGCVGGCQSDYFRDAICEGGEWGCPGGLVRTSSCGPCIGLAPPGYTCGPSGWVPIDGGAGGNGGGAGDGGGGAGGYGGAGGGSGGAGGAAGQGGSSTDGGSDSSTDGGSDAATCSGTGATCLLGSCSNDVAMPATCRGGVWACPPGTVDVRSCHGCTGNPPPGWVCGDGGWMNADASSGGGGG